MQRTHSSAARITRACPLLLPLVVVAAGCGSPTPNDLVRIDTPGIARYAVSTEDGLLALPGDDLMIDEVSISLWFNGFPVFDEARVTRRAEDLYRLTPKSAKLPIAEFAAAPADPDEPLFVQTIEDDPEHLPRLIGARLMADGQYGDLLEVTSWFWSADDLAAEFPGAGVYALRKGRYVLVGILNGLVVTNPDTSFLGRWFGPNEVVAYLSLDAIAPVLPENSDFFRRRTRAFRSDFEHGIPR